MSRKSAFAEAENRRDAWGVAAGYGVDVELTDYLRIARQRWVSIGIITLVAVAIAGVATWLQEATYKATTQLYVSVGSAGSAMDVVQGSNFAEKRVTSYVTLATSPRILEQVITELNLPMRSAELSQSVSVTAPPQTVLINISATNNNPALAAEISNSVAENLISSVAEVEDVELARISIFEPASAPAQPSSPNVRTNLLLGAGAGLLLGFGIAVCRELLDTRIRSEEDVKRVSDVSVLGTFANDPETERLPLLTQGDPYSARAEGFRQLRTNVRFTNIGGGPHTVVVSSSIPGEGKTSTAANLAIMLAEGGTKVLLVDADLRRPRVATYFGLEGVIGLSTLLTNQVDIADAIQPWGPGGALHVLTSGRFAPNPSELLGSSHMEDLVRELECSYEVILIDAPPILPVTDPTLLGSIASGILLVVSAEGRTHRGELERALESIRAVQANVLGVVVNRLPAVKNGRGYYDYKPDVPIEFERNARRAKRHSVTPSAPGMRHT